jgi:hypothetical protein
VTWNTARYFGAVEQKEASPPSSSTLTFQLNSTAERLQAGSLYTPSSIEKTKDHNISLHC